MGFKLEIEGGPEVNQVLRVRPEGFFDWRWSWDNLVVVVARLLNRSITETRECLEGYGDTINKLVCGNREAWALRVRYRNLLRDNASWSSISRGYAYRADEVMARQIEKMGDFSKREKQFAVMVALQDAIGYELIEEDKFKEREANRLGLGRLRLGNGLQRMLSPLVSDSVFGSVVGSAGLVAIEMGAIWAAVASKPEIATGLSVAAPALVWLVDKLFFGFDGNKMFNAIDAVVGLMWPTPFIDQGRSERLSELVFGKDGADKVYKNWEARESRGYEVGRQAPILAGLGLSELHMPASGDGVRFGNFLRGIENGVKDQFRAFRPGRREVMRMLVAHKAAAVVSGWISDGILNRNGDRSMQIFPFAQVKFPGVTAEEMQEMRICFSNLLKQCLRSGEFEVEYGAVTLGNNVKVDVVQSGLRVVVGN